MQAIKWRIFPCKPTILDVSDAQILWAGFVVLAGEKPHCKPTPMIVLLSFIEKTPGGTSSLPDFCSYGMRVFSSCVRGVWLHCVPQSSAANAWIKHVAGSTSLSQPLTRQQRWKGLGWHSGLYHLLCARINPPHKWSKRKQVKNCVMSYLGEIMLTKLLTHIFLFFSAQRKGTTIFPCEEMFLQR